MSSLGLINCRIQLRFNTGVNRSTEVKTSGHLSGYDKFDRATCRACCVHLGHSHDCRALLSRPPIHRQANLAFFRGERDLLGQGRGLTSDVLSCASHGAWCNLRVHSEVTRTLCTHSWCASYAVLLSRTSPVGGPPRRARRRTREGTRPSPLHPS